MARLYLVSLNLPNGLYIAKQRSTVNETVNHALIEAVTASEKAWIEHSYGCKCNLNIT